MPSRRSFVKQSFGIAVLGGALPEIFARAASAQPLVGAGEADQGNVLVVVQLGGGNDGLNTVIPFTDDGYHRVRPAIGIAEKAALPIDDRIALNPVMAPMLELYKEGKLAIVQGVGYPNPNRSHFESTQILETGSPDRPATYGWLGRYLDRTEPPAQANAAAAGTAPSFRAVSLLDIV